MTRTYYLLAIIAMILMNSCKEAYMPPVESTNQSYLVVEGILNTNGQTRIRLTRSLKLEDTANIRPELNATLTVEGRDNTVQSLIPQGGGYYASTGLNLVLNNEYRLRIRTTSAKEYTSDYIVAKLTPTIDSVGWKREQDGVQLYINTHDADDDTRYYRWEYEETWEIRSTYNAEFKYIGNGTVVRRAPADNVWVCWKYGSSSSVILGSSARLQSDVIYQAPLTFIDNGSEKISVRYSILVRQYSLDKAGYEFYDRMKRMTESIGTVFDPQPSELRGNLHCLTDPNELVVGYLSIASIDQKRIFISRSELPAWPFALHCPSTAVANKKDTLEAYYGSGQYLPYQSIIDPNNQVIGYESSFPYCVDCTTRGGSVVKPSYW